MLGFLQFIFESHLNEASDYEGIYIHNTHTGEIHSDKNRHYGQQHLDLLTKHHPESTSGKPYDKIRRGYYKIKHKEKELHLYDHHGMYVHKDVASHILNKHKNIKDYSAKDHGSWQGSF